MSRRVLLVEDDTTLSMIVAETLQREGFDVTVAVNGEEGLYRFTAHGADIIVADVMMPRMDGFDMARKIRTIDAEVPILFLTAKSDIDDIVEGFELGGNDYLKKPFKMLELIVRIKALLRRQHGCGESSCQIGSYVFHPVSQSLVFPGKEPVELSNIEAKILKELANNVGRTVDSSVLMTAIWQRDDPYSRNSLHGFIHKLRCYLRHDKSIMIINQRGIGYMLAVKCGTETMTRRGGM